MRLDNPQLVELLAERYVLGVQRGAARRRFAALARVRDDAGGAVRQWEERLAPLAWNLPPIEPSDLLWQRLCREIGIGAAGGGKPARGSGGWQALAAALALVAIVSAGGWWRAAHRPPEVVRETVIERVPEQVAVAVIAGDDGRPLWLTRIAPQSGEFTVRAINEVERRPDNDYELWALTDAGVPVSMGLLPQAGERTVHLSPDALRALAVSSQVAVSLEPPGGSPEPGPTGPVLYTGALLAP